MLVICVRACPCVRARPVHTPRPELEESPTPHMKEEEEPGRDVTPPRPTHPTFTFSMGADCVCVCVCE